MYNPPDCRSEDSEVHSIQAVFEHLRDEICLAGATVTGSGRELGQFITKFRFVIIYCGGYCFGYELAPSALLKT